MLARPRLSAYPVLVAAFVVAGCAKILDLKERTFDDSGAGRGGALCA